MKKQKNQVTRAAGGIVYRDRSDGEREVALIHRPRYDDWTLPKGKVDPGETIHKAAEREVEEETGFKVERQGGSVIARNPYRDRKGRMKIVYYYFMTPIGGEFRPNDEVDEVRWLTLDEALALLTHDRDREMLAALLPHAPPL